jgi:hypothetical protein
MSNLSESFIAKCLESWDEEFIPGVKNQFNAAGFVKSVAKKTGVPIPEEFSADSILDYISLGWIRHETGSSAARQAAKGAFVLAGLKGKDHKPSRINGHIAIVIGGQLVQDKYPMVWSGGGTGLQSMGNRCVADIWSFNDCDHVVYYSYKHISHKYSPR